MEDAEAEPWKVGETRTVAGVQCDLTDGCAAQFDGKVNYHQVAVWPTKVGTKRNHSILITMHGKNICDSLSNVILAALRSAVANGEIADPGTRALVLWLAEHRQAPSIAKLKKEGWWAIDDIYYGYYDPRRFTKVAVPEAKGFSGSAEKHRFVSSPITDAERAAREGPVDVSYAFCGCLSCSRFNFQSCMMSGLGGMGTKLVRKYIRSMGDTGQPSQSQTLEEFARSLAKKQLHAVAVDAAEIDIEGDFWLCLVLGSAQQATARQAQATDLFEEGWWIVQIKWYLYETGSNPRRYKLLPNSTRWLSVSAMIRLEGLAFEEGQTRSASKGICVFSNDSTALVRACM